MKFVISIFLSSVLILIGYFLFDNCIDFELKVYESYLSTYFLTGIVSRILISLYFVISIFIIFHRTTKIIAYSALLLLLLPLYFFVFDYFNQPIIKLQFTIINTVWLTSLLLGAAILGVLFLLKNKYTFSFQKKWITISKYILAIATTTLVFVFNPLFPDEFTDEPTTNISVNQSVISALSIGEEKTLCAFFSTSCPYCEQAAKRLKILQKRYNEFPPIKIFFVGTQEGINWFFIDTKTSFEYDTLNRNSFMEITKGSFPRFAVIKNKKITNYYSGLTFNYATPSVISLN